MNRRGPDAPLQGLLWGGLFVLPFWVLVAVALWRGAS